MLCVKEHSLFGREIYGCERQHRESCSHPRKLKNRVGLTNIYVHPKPHHEFYLNWSWQSLHVENETVSALELLDHALAITITQLFPATGREPEMAH